MELKEHNNPKDSTEMWLSISVWYLCVSVNYNNFECAPYEMHNDNYNISIEQDVFCDCSLSNIAICVEGFLCLWMCVYFLSANILYYETFQETWNKTFATMTK